ncbi:MAG: GNAT family N-acetyltransferase [Acidobacteriia bacterium]|nr:GNAT family N-acetyltransferase [Terriglobia bacterium]
MKSRRARPADLPALASLIAHYAEAGLLLPRSEGELRARLADFLVLEDTAGLAGCVALELYGPHLAEIRSLAVRPGAQGRGLGRRLLRYALNVARRRRIAQVFAVTESPEFFLRHGFMPAAREAFPEKLQRDCQGCPKRRNCRLHAVVLTLYPLPKRSDPLTVLAPTTAALAAR